MSTKPQKKKEIKKHPKTNINEIICISILAAGILLFLSIYITDSTGPFGLFIKDVLLGLFGICAYLIPIIIIAYSLTAIIKNISCKAGTIIHICIMLALMSAMIQTGFYKQEEFQNLSPLNSIVKIYEESRALDSGGAIGGIISIPFIAIFQVPGTIVILTTLAIINVIMLTNVSILGILKAIKGFFAKLAVSLFNGIAGIFAGKTGKRSKRDDIFKDIVIIDSTASRSNSRVIDFQARKAEAGKPPRDTEEARTAEDAGKRAGSRKKSNKAVVGSDPETHETHDTHETCETSEPSDSLKTGKQHEMLYRYPPAKLLNGSRNEGKNLREARMQALEGARILEDTLKSFGVSAKVSNITRGPAVTRYELQPESGVKVSRILSLADDISLNMATSEVRIEAPIPGKAAIGIEIPNKEVEIVYLREIIESQEFKQHNSRLVFALGKDVAGNCIVADIAQMPHLLIAGATGAGKSVCINNLIVSILYKASPDEVKLLLIDPKVVELTIYNGIPHMLIPVVTEPKKAAGALNWAVQEMSKRYRLFADCGVRDLAGYNNIAQENEEMEKLPQIVIIIDELSDLMMISPKEVEDSICRLAQMARAAGMHLVIATQRPSVDVITGTIKANIPSRISFAVSSQVDSRTILDTSGAEKLLGRGDMLFYPVGRPKPVRIQGAFVSEKEVERVVEFVKNHGCANYDEDIMQEISNETDAAEDSDNDWDELLPQAIECVIDAGQASVSLIQRRFRVGYARAARMIDQMEARGIIGGFEGSKPRQVLVSRQQWLEMKSRE